MIAAMRLMLASVIAAVAGLGSLVSQTSLTAAEFAAIDANRDALQNTAGLLAAMKIVRGDWVADVGAGGGYHAMRMAALTGPDGRGFAEEISDASIRYLDARVKLFDLGNVTVVRGAADDPRLPAGALAAVPAVDTYHHFAEPGAMLNKILLSLKPGGLLVVADYSIADHRKFSRPAQIKVHEIDPVVVRMEAEAAGFEFVHIDDPFVIWKSSVGNTPGIPTDLWLLVLKRPA